MTGTVINIITILIGGCLGALMGDRLPPRMREIVVHGIGLVVLAVGIDMALESNNVLVLLGSIVLGGILGEWWQLDKRLEDSGRWIEDRAARFPILTKGEFTRGFVTASLVFCIGPLAFLGSIQDGLSGDYSLLAIKSMMDLFSSMAFSAAMGMGVAFSALSVMVVQGSLTLGAALFEGFLNDAIIVELSATGGVMLVGLGLLMLDIKRIRVVNFMPALLLVPLLVLLWERFGTP